MLLVIAGAVLVRDADGKHPSIQEANMEANSVLSEVFPFAPMMLDTVGSAFNCLAETVDELKCSLIRALWWVVWYKAQRTYSPKAR